MLGCRSRARGSNGLYLEHVLRMDSTFAAAQKARQCSEKVTGDPYFLWCRQPRDLPTDPCVHFYGFPSPFGSGGGGRTSKPSTPYPRRGKGAKERVVSCATRGGGRAGLPTDTWGVAQPPYQWVADGLCLHVGQIESNQNRYQIKSKPVPNSIPFTALMLIIAFDNSESSF